MHRVRDAVQEASELNFAGEAPEGHVSDDCIVLFPAAGVTAVVADDGVRRSGPQHDGVPQVRGRRQLRRVEAGRRGVEVIPSERVDLHRARGRGGARRRKS
eukprot:scaffold8382_cov668-Pinguiococcus_pyrenoidosus.AAC.1